MQQVNVIYHMTQCVNVIRESDFVFLANHLAATQITNTLISVGNLTIDAHQNLPAQSSVLFIKSRGNQVF